MTGAESLQLFQQLVASANSLFLSDDDFVTINGITKPTLKKIYAEFLASIGVYPTIADGLAGTNGTGTNNRFFTVPATGDKAETRYRNDGGVAVEINSILSFLVDSLTVNRGKGYPLRQKIRAGVTSVQSSSWNTFLLDVVVVNARQGEYYRLSYQANENGGNGFNWIIEKYDSATYATTAAGRVELIPLAGTQPQFTRAGGIQTVILVPASRPEMQFKITVDPAGLPAAGTPINSNSNSAFEAWSWIIDESCYTYASEYKSPMIDTLSINAGKVFPLNSTLPRAGVINADYQPFRDLFLDIEISGAGDGKLYRVSYVAATAVTPVDVTKANIGFRIEEFDKATYETTGTAFNIQNFTTPVGVISRTGGPQTLTFTPAERSSMKVKITVDGAKIPADGSAFASVNAGFPGRNWIIDESRCKQSTIVVPVGDPQKPGVYYSYTPSTKLLTVAYLSGEYAYRVTIKPGAINQLPDINTIERAPKVPDLAYAVWSAIPGATNIETDYLPPMQVEAANNGDGAARIYTGGAHGSDGEAGGSPTARNALFTVYADGQILQAASSGYAESVQCMIFNELMGYNTISLGRYICNQVFSLDVSGSGIGIHAEIAAKEDIKVYVDNGPQCYFGGFNTNQMLPDSQAPTRTALDPTVVSGAKELYPKAWLLLMKSAYGTMATWVDRSYKTGDGRYLGAGASFIRGGGAGRAKFYNAIVAAFTATIAAGSSYQWRGGFHFFSDTAETGFDTKVALTVGTRKLVAVTTAGESLAA